MFIRRQKIIIALVCGALLGLVSIAWGVHHRRAAPSAHGHWVRVSRQTSVQPVVFKSTLQPADAVNIASPIEGKLVSQAVQWGDKVKAGQLLFEVDVSELTPQLREAEIGVIQAEKELALARGLETGAEYRASERRLASAHAAFDLAQQRISATQNLYDNGIIARMELDTAHQELESLQETVRGAQDELDNLKQKKAKNALRVLELELQNRTSRLAELREKRSAARVVSPISGVVLHPVQSGTSLGAGSSGVTEFKPGYPITSKDVVMSVGLTSAFVIKADVDELDVDRIHVNQPASISLAANADQTCAGVVSHISSQARASEGRMGGQGGASFEVQVLMKAPPGQELRVGGTVSVTLQPKAGPSGLYIPLSAVTWNPQGAPVVRARKPGQPARSLKITAANTTQNGVEVQSGLTEDQEVWVPESAQEGEADNPGLVDRLLSRVNGEEAP